jgi:hypothetical protein
MTPPSNLTLSEADVTFTISSQANGDGSVDIAVKTDKVGLVMLRASSFVFRFVSPRAAFNPSLVTALAAGALRYFYHPGRRSFQRQCFPRTAWNNGTDRRRGGGDDITAALFFPRFAKA